MENCYETDRLRLYLSNIELGAKVCDYYLRNRLFLKETDQIREDKFYTLDYQNENLENDMKMQRERTNYRFWITVKNDKDIIGYFAFNNIIMGSFKSCFLSYALDEKFINRGLMTEAIEKAIEIAFVELGLHRIEANIIPSNLSSLRVVEKLGFKNEGLAKEYLLINGKWEDHIHMVLLNSNS